MSFESVWESGNRWRRVDNALSYTQQARMFAREHENRELVRLEEIAAERIEPEPRAE